MSQDLAQQSQRLSQWFQQQAIPFWREHSLVAGLGTSIERFTPSGEVDRLVNVRVRVQARQAFFFTAAEAMGWCEGGAAIGAKMLHYVETHAAHPTAGEGYTHLFSPRFEVIDQRQDLYDHAFFLLAYAWQYRVSGNTSALARAEALIAHWDRHFAAPNGGWYEGDYDYTWRRQNPHMHLFEAFMALYEACGDKRWLARAGDMFGLFERVFFNAGQGVLLEFFNEHWQPAASVDGQVVEPGHMFEWVWLLDWYERLTGRDVSEYLQCLYRRALELGYKTDSGLVYDSVTSAGDILQPTKRCWGLTELIKASLVMAARGDGEAEARAVRSVNALFDYYLCAPTPGTYVDQRGEQDEVVEASAPASTLYHLLVLMQELQAHTTGE